MQDQAERATFRATGDRRGPPSVRVGCCAKRRLLASSHRQRWEKRNDHRAWRTRTKSGLQARTSTSSRVHLVEQAVNPILRQLTLHLIRCNPGETGSKTHLRKCLKSANEPGETCATRFWPGWKSLKTIAMAMKKTRYARLTGFIRAFQTLFHRVFEKDVRVANELIVRCRHTRSSKVTAGVTTSNNRVFLARRAFQTLSEMRCMLGCAHAGAL